jgi:hypothetical protein
MLVRPAVSALALVAALHARAGVVIEGQGDDGASRIVIDGKRLRMEGSGGADRRDAGAMIYDGDTRKMVQLDLEKKTYTEFTQEDMRAMRGIVERSMKSMPPEQREKVAQARAKGGAKWEKAGRSDKALGTSCDVYRLVREGKSEDEVCAAPFGAFGVQKSDLAGLRAFGDAMNDMTGGAGDEGVLWAEMPGVPLIGWDLAEGGARKETFRATKVEKSRVPASEFAVPAGFKKGPGFAEQMKEMEQMQHQVPPEVLQQLQQMEQRQKDAK